MCDLNLVMETLFITNLIQGLLWNSLEDLNLLNTQHLLRVEPGEGLTGTNFMKNLVGNICITEDGTDA